MNIFKMTVEEDRIATVTVDLPGEKYNVLNEQALRELEAILDEFERSRELAAIVILSAKEDNFLVGADISLFSQFQSEDAAYQGARAVQKLFSRLRNSSKPTVCAIGGVCVGGGLEIALNCHYRLASDHPKTSFALPEVKLGLLPGATGTQLILRQVSPPELALEMLLTGKTIYPARAKAIGLIDEIVPKELLATIAKTRAIELADRRRKARPIDLTTPLRYEKSLLAVAEEKVAQQKLYPAPKRILEVVRTGLEEGFEAGLEAEAKAFGELVVSTTARNLIHLFFASNEAKKDNSVAAQPREVSKIGILGAGLMGAGIAAVAVDSGYMVRMKDKEYEAVGRGLKYLAGVLREKYERRREGQREIDHRLALASGTIDYTGFKTVDFVIEAVFEDVKLKHEVIKEVEAYLPERAIFASNTSAIPITLLSQASTRRDRFIGMHFFSPVHKMSLVEIITTQETSDETTATTFELARRLGKTPIIVRDGVGFYTSRVFGRYVCEGHFALEEGYRIEDIDAAATRIGFPVGPITVTDEVGIDVAAKAGKVMQQVFGSRMKSSDSIAKLVAEGRLGRKNGRGFYLYTEGKKGGVDYGVYALLPHGYERKPADLDELSERLLLAFINEAVYCLQEGILRSARDGDVGGVLGIGFPPMLGGPFRYIDYEGADKLVSRLKKLAEKYGERFEPAAMLVEIAQTGRKFY
ncbi:MAG: 3-hydroxyacyl-CoA dehydrogenase NAD-binding domain-containing protein [Acidobacteriota bacterium]|nr:3-hydroxyacyl-CoA dehydrogenase NAD-binding domain-containing protein [Blastocatellia bacterium]MDW8411834.1 3-hydroxyacyl-CoA dehydrogenase NAD-binding domain-containing protein [Acidobacteriota bacterium]